MQTNIVQGALVKDSLGQVLNNLLLLYKLSALVLENILGEDPGSYVSPCSRRNAKHLNRVLKTKKVLFAFLTL